MIIYIYIVLEHAINNKGFNLWENNYEVGACTASPQLARQLLPQPLSLCVHFTDEHIVFLRQLAALPGHMFLRIYHIYVRVLLTITFCHLSLSLSL
jgi:hypothetical protein